MSLSQFGKTLCRASILFVTSSFSLASHAGIYQDAVAQLGYSELAATFSREKALALSTLADEENLSLSELQAAATLQLLGAPLINAQATNVQAINESSSATGKTPTTNNLLIDNKALADFVAHYHQPDPAYLGQLTEASLYQRVESLWKTTAVVAPSAFALELRQLIGQGIATGYNLISSPWPKFAPERQLIYGHSDIDHAQQLLALLASEGLQARVGFSRKTSAFLYRDDWGAINQPLIDLGNKRRLVEASEYDLHFEFPSAADKTKFVAVINRYAKKDSAKQTGLIYGAWWQPFYRSKTASEGFASATQIAVSNGQETALLLALPAQAPNLVKAIQQLNPGWTVTPEAIWVNLAFHRYLQGDFK
jgi:hypothetical protein